MMGTVWALAGAFALSLVHAAGVDTASVPVPDSTRDAGLLGPPSTTMSSPLGGSTFERLLQMHALRGLDGRLEHDFGPGSIDGNFSGPILKILEVLSRISVRLDGSKRSLSDRQLQLANRCKHDMEVQGMNIQKWEKKEKTFSVIAQGLAGKVRRQGRQTSIQKRGVGSDLKLAQEMRFLEEALEHRDRGRGGRGSTRQRHRSHHSRHRGRGQQGIIAASKAPNASGNASGDTAAWQATSLHDAASALRQLLLGSSKEFHRHMPNGVLESSRQGKNKSGVQLGNLTLHDRIRAEKEESIHALEDELD